MGDLLPTSPIDEMDPALAEVVQDVFAAVLKSVERNDGDKQRAVLALQDVLSKLLATDPDAATAKGRRQIADHVRAATKSHLDTLAAYRDEHGIHLFDYLAHVFSATTKQ